MHNNSFESPLTKVKGLGSAKSGTTHFIYQRLSAVFLIPLVIWLVITILKLFHLNPQDAKQVLALPMNIILISLFIVISLYHGMLGMKVIIEDYVHCTCIKNILLVLLYMVTISTLAVGIFTAFNSMIPHA